MAAGLRYGPTATANGSREDQLRNFLVNILTGTFGLRHADNADIDSADIYEVLVGATTEGTSISTLCDRRGEAPSGNTVLYHHHTKFNLNSVKAVANMLLQEYTLSASLIRRRWSPTPISDRTMPTKPTQTGFTTVKRKPAL